ncbi:MAG: pyridoxal phosphate-dependent aminotransferase [Gemmatimonadetes bacterium]|nr:pyridoxal phosphate-dependent aminotransferase [Gemmatimonadota bacterium]
MKLSLNVDSLQESATIYMSTLAKRLRAEGRHILDLSAGEPDFDTPEWVKDRAIAAVRAGATKYTQVAGLPELRKAIAAQLERQAGRPIPWEGVVTTCGVKHGLFNTCFTLFGPGDHVLVTTPYWTSYPQIVLLSRAEPLSVQGAEENSFKVTPEDLDHAVTPSTRGLIVCSPSNPTGAVYSLEELEAVARWAKERGIWLLSDEIYGQIYYGEGRRAPGVLDLSPDALGPYVLLDGFSKSIAMTGWRLGFTYCEPELAAKLTALQSQVTSNPATPSQHAALAALQDQIRASASIAEMREAFQRRRDLVVRLMREHLPDVDFVYPEGAFYLFFRIDAFIDSSFRDSTSLCRAILERSGVAMVPGAAFGDDRYMRLSFATSDDVLRQAIERMARALRGEAVESTT